MKKVILTYHSIVISIVLLVGIVRSIMYQDPYLIIALLLIYIGILFSLSFLLLFQKKTKANIGIFISTLLIFLEINIVYILLLPFGGHGSSDNYLSYLNHMFTDCDFGIVNWSILITKLIFIAYLIVQYKKLSKQEN